MLFKNLLRLGIANWQVTKIDWVFEMILRMNTVDVILNIFHLRFDNVLFVPSLLWSGPEHRT